MVLQYNASSVPILQLGLGGKGLWEQMLYDLAANFIRTQLATVQGASVLQPLGGKPRQVMVDVDPQALFARGISPADVSAAINAQNLIPPTGEVKIGDRAYPVSLNSSTRAVAALHDFPIKQQGGATVLVRDVAHVFDQTLKAAEAQFAQARALAGAGGA
jgi:multidrug efflux pump subunit AcrB